MCDTRENTKEATVVKEKKKHGALSNSGKLGFAFNSFPLNSPLPPGCNDPARTIPRNALYI